MVNCPFCRYPLLMFGTLDPRVIDSFGQFPCTNCGAAFEVGIKVLRKPKYEGAELEARMNKSNHP